MDKAQRAITEEAMFRISALIIKYVKKGVRPELVPK
jgi:hypothetical protein